MNQNKVIGLTGSIATGKSQVSNYLKDKGIKVVDADLIARDVANYKSVKNKIKKEFGDDLYINDQLDRKKLAEIIFDYFSQHFCLYFCKKNSPPKIK